eukprot:2795795-Rhodomonas_salina.5
MRYDIVLSTAVSGTDIARGGTRGGGRERSQERSQGGSQGRRWKRTPRSSAGCSTSTRYVYAATLAAVLVWRMLLGYLLRACYGIPGTCVWRMLLRYLLRACEGYYATVLSATPARSTGRRYAATPSATLVLRAARYCYDVRCYGICYACTTACPVLTVPGATRLRKTL